MRNYRYLICLLLAVASNVRAAEPIYVVLQNGRMIPTTSLSLVGDKLVPIAPIEGIPAGQQIPLQSADHIFGTKPVEINQAIALILTGKHAKAQPLLAEIVRDQALTAKISGNYWMEAARALLLVHALKGDTENVNALGKQIADMTPAPGVDPTQLLAKSLLTSSTSSNYEAREASLKSLIHEKQRADVAAYASFFLGNTFKMHKKNGEALEAYLTVSCIYPSVSLTLNAASEMYAADLLADSGRREEAVSILKSAIRSSTDTVLADEINKRLTSLK